MKSGTKRKRRSAAVRRSRPQGSRLQVCLAVGVGSLAAGYAVVAVLLGVMFTITPHVPFSLSGTLAAAGPGWLAAYQVPIEIADKPLGVLPLVPTIAVWVLVAMSASAALRRIRAERAAAVSIIGAVAACHAVPGMVIAAVADGDPFGVSPLAASLTPTLLAGVAAAGGIVRARGGVGALRTSVDPLARNGMRAGVRGLFILLGVSMLVFGVATARSASTVRDMVHVTAPETGGTAGILLLSLGYVPNAAVLVLGFLTGPGLSIGAVSLSPFTVSDGSLPAFPVFAGVPEHTSSWWPVFLIFPAAAGVLVGWSLRRVAGSPFARLRAVAVAGAVAGLGVVVLGTLAGGRLADGVWDPVSYPPGLVSLAVFAWISLPGAVVSWFGGPRLRRKRPRTRSGRRGTPRPSGSAATR